MLILYTADGAEDMCCRQASDTFGPILSIWTIKAWSTLRPARLVVLAEGTCNVQANINSRQSAPAYVNNTVLVVDSVLGVLHGQVVLPEKRMRFLTETVRLHFLLVAFNCDLSAPLFPSSVADISFE